MNKAQKFRQNAELCRRLAAGDGPHKTEIIMMAETGERLARELEQETKKQSEHS